MTSRLDLLTKINTQTVCKSVGNEKRCENGHHGNDFCNKVE